MGNSKERVPITEFIMPIGKYKGVALPNIYRVNPQYLLWASTNMENNIGKRCKEFLEYIESQLERF